MVLGRPVAYSADMGVFCGSGRPGMQTQFRSREVDAAGQTWYAWSCHRGPVGPLGAAALLFRTVGRLSFCPGFLIDCGVQYGISGTCRYTAGSRAAPVERGAAVFFVEVCFCRNPKLFYFRQKLSDANP